MKGMILAAGLGTRLRPLTYEIPKPVVPALGRPLCTYNMEFLARAGVRSFLLNLHHHPKIVQQRVTGWAGRKYRVAYTVEPMILGTGGGIWNARDFLKDGTFVTANSDTVVRFPFGPALAFHREKKALATLVLFPDPGGKYTPVRIDGDGRIAGFGDFGGAGTRAGFYTGFQIVEPQLIDRIPAGRPSCIVRETYNPLVDEGGPVYGYLCSGSFRDFGSPAEYLDGVLSLLSERAAEGTLPKLDLPGVVVVPPVFVSPGARVLAGATIGPDAVIEESATVAQGAVVARSLLWPGASVGAGEQVRATIVTARTRVSVSPGNRSCLIPGT